MVKSQSEKWVQLYYWMDYKCDKYGNIVYGNKGIVFALEGMNGKNKFHTLCYITIGGNMVSLKYI